MKISLFCIVLLFVVLTGSMSHADELLFSGILANSGEAGSTLITSKPLEGRTGIGVAVDRQGRLWSRAGRGLLNCYETDGRLVRQYKIDGNATHQDRIVCTDNLVVLMIRGVIWTLPINASENTKLNRLLTDNQCMASDAYNNRVLLQVKDGSIQWYDPDNGKLEPVSFDPAPTKINELIVAPDGEVILYFDKNIHRYANGKEITDEFWPRPATAERLQCFGDQWFGHAWHGTIKRFDAGLNPEPGVVLGGGSGSFIGFLPENPDLGNGRNMVRLDRNVYAVGGIEGIIQILYYDAPQQRMQLIRRIGSLPSCPTLAINDQGVIWASGGTWPWDGLPDTPMPEGDRAGEPQSQMIIMPNGYAVCMSNRYGKPDLANGPYLQGGMTRVNVGGGLDSKKLVAPLAKNYPAAAVLTIDKRLCLMMVSDQGEGRLFRISDRGEFYQDLGIASITFTTPVKQCTSLAKVNDDTVLLAADGAIITLQYKDKAWTETSRITQWGKGPGDHFGERVTIVADANRLWVSDTSRHRVLVLDMAGKNLLSSYGKTDKPGDSIETLNMPQTIAANGNRAVVFDAQNQRLVRLTYQAQQ